MPYDFSTITLSTVVGISGLIISEGGIKQLDKPNFLSYIYKIDYNFKIS